MQTTLTAYLATSSRLHLDQANIRSLRQIGHPIFTQAQTKCQGLYTGWGQALFSYAALKSTAWDINASMGSECINGVSVIDVAAQKVFFAPTPAKINDTDPIDSWAYTFPCQRLTPTLASSGS